MSAPVGHMADPKYRADIDGLRAVAVLLVLGDHLKLPVTGGYVGVDVFFVISGYLIGSVILRSMQTGTFTFAGFYERRIRRIVPAFVVMLLGVSALAWQYQTPSELSAFGSSLLAAMASVSNILFAQQTGYFDTPSAFKPLLHTWSLGVEEQFYIVFPVFLFAVRRWMPHRLKAIILTTAATSFALACFWVYHDETTAYFMAPLRAWELLVGTIVSQRYVPLIQGTLMRNVLATAGLLCILGPAFMYTSETAFPGLAALAPCLGTAAVIAAGAAGPTLVGRMLSLRPIVFVGLISYSLYLWHWPLIVFQNTANILHLRPGDHGVALKLAAVSVLLAILSWRFVEQPFRAGAWRPSTRDLFLWAGATAATVVTVGLTMRLSQGLPWRYPDAALEVARFMDYNEARPYRRDVCFIVGPSSTFADFKPSICLATTPAPDGRRKRYLLLGDSHAASLYAGLKQSYPDADLMQATSAGCRPFLPASPDMTIDVSCARLLKYIFNDFLSGHPVDAVLLAGRWHASDAPNLAATVAWLQQRGMQPVIFGPSIEYDQPLPRVLAVSLRDGRPDEVPRHRSYAPEELDREFSVLARSQWHATYISMYEDLCTSPSPSGSFGATTCPVYGNAGTPILFDLDHLTADGSIFFAHVVRARHQLPDKAAQ